MALTVLSLDEASSALAIGREIYFDTPKSNISMQTFVSGSPSYSVALQGTIDGVHWDALASASVTGIASSVGKPVIGARVLLAQFSGSPGASVSALIAAA